jgi:hypothetical protein
MEAATQQDAAAAKKAEKAAKERARRARIKALELAELDPKTKLDDEQRARAENAPGGMRKKALAHFILEGKGSKEQQEDGKAERKVADKVERAKRTSKDPEATELAARVQAQARKVGLKSAFLPQDAREFLTIVGKDGKASDLLLGVLPPEKEGEPKRDLDVSRLSAWAETKGAQDPEVRRVMKDLSAGRKVWGRKLALFILEQIRREGAA